uniref:protein-serine/threonine phosphatase n=2 Tax=Attheya septentrionalis TaxID=420275 RepID=A0A7S2U5T7_9STRA|mmetsp:Transcript_11691/g.21268  ORF Transcript_11691/g.21268 Transcript_11691/m.21268 type:complete len:467 (+) Transcript_11691:225-1625(+)|eukprot:CAMPEP_0198280274 /NCGR_PEP_ID=MMETSP1449-20131203/368_1 /TAXON_ID=420275 /ORGANISM="Attheya septentrionalis, Strain CCMP2084" /LENGTH=466 /DNA_ID=CAMNT_0043975577 /DNA_START=194 /DNA_END=1594 /DNA_ORIENTATION=-
MGNLLGSPITEKETHIGTTPDGLSFGVSSMQGWRIHMEDAHICQPHLYAEEIVSDAPSTSSAPPATAGETGEMMAITHKKKEYTQISIPGHSLYAVFDGHGGSFAAEYAGRNMCRVISRQLGFVEYGKWVQARPTTEPTMTDDKEKEKYIRGGLALLEGSLRDAFIQIDREIMREVQGFGNEDANMHYGKNYDGEVGGAAAPPGTPGMGDTHSDVKGVATDPTADHPRPNHEEDSGTTAIVVIVTPDWIVCANAGDSRAVYSKDGHRAIALSYDHKPDDEYEERRIKDAGGYVSHGRVEGDLAVSRGLGDFRFKDIDTVLWGIRQRSDSTLRKPEDQKVSPVPDIIVNSRDATLDEFIVLACDGIWDVATNQECVKSVADIFNEGESDLGLISEEVLDECLIRGSKDNMTTLVVKFNAQQIGEGGGVKARRELKEAATAAQEAIARSKGMTGGGSGDNGPNSQMFS